MTAVTPGALHHTAFLVRDLEGTARRLKDALGIGPWHTWTIEPSECRVRGKVSPFSFRVALATMGGEIGSLVEVLYLDPTRLPPPEGTIS